MNDYSLFDGKQVVSYPDSEEAYVDDDKYNQKSIPVLASGFDSDTD